MPIFLLFFGLIMSAFVAIGATAIIRTARRRRAHARLVSQGAFGKATVVDTRMTTHQVHNGTSLWFQPVVVLDNQDDATPVVLDVQSRTSFVPGSKLDVVYDPADHRKVALVTAPGITGYVIGGLTLVVPLVFGSYFLSFVHAIDSASP